MRIIYFLNNIYFYTSKAGLLQRLNRVNFMLHNELLFFIHDLYQLLILHVNYIRVIF